MKLSDIDDWVQRRLLDDASEDFTKGQRVSAINVAAQLVQKEVQKVDPDAFRRIYTANLELDSNRYQYPRGFLKLKLLVLNGVKAEAVPEEWIFLQGQRDNAMLLRSVEAGYALAGGEIVIYPTPAANVEDGLELLYVPALGMSDDDEDLSEFGLVEPLHMAVVLWAVKLLKPETGERDKDIDAEIREILSDIGTYYPLSPAGAGPAHAIRIEGLGKQVQ
jgi:hypothetical protein